MTFDVDGRERGGTSGVQVRWSHRTGRHVQQLVTGSDYFGILMDIICSLSSFCKLHVTLQLFILNHLDYMRG